MSRLSGVDKLCLTTVAALWFGLAAIETVWDSAAIQPAEADKPPAVIVTAPPIEYADFLAAHKLAMEAVQKAAVEVQENPVESFESFDWESVPLSPECRAALVEACIEHNVPICDVLGLIEVESDFREDAVNGVCVGLMQTNSKYADVFEENTGYSIYTPEGNIRCGVWYLGELLERYDGDTGKALTAYNSGRYRGVVTQYAKNVLQASKKWGCG